MPFNIAERFRGLGYVLLAMKLNPGVASPPRSKGSQPPRVFDIDASDLLMRDQWVRRRHLPSPPRHASKRRRPLGRSYEG
jgi:hypothetical protein